MNAFKHNVLQVLVDLFLASSSVLLLSALFEAVLPGFVTSIVDLRWFFVLLLATLSGIAIYQDEERRVPDRLRRTFIACMCAVAGVLVVGIIALQGSGVLIRLASVLLVIFFILILIAVHAYDSRRSH